MKKAPNDNAWTVNIGNFSLRISVADERYWEKLEIENDAITKHGTFRIVLHEYSKLIADQYDYIDLLNDDRFRNYQPIQYNIVNHINFSDGTHMPLLYLCELIRYLYRLSDLTAFV